MRVRRPAPTGEGTVDHSELALILSKLKTHGVRGLADDRELIGAYRSGLEKVIPYELSRGEALAFWLNLYNAGALDIAAEAFVRAETTVLRVPGAFSRTWATVAGEDLSLEDIEHGKIRRFKDPRIHGALVCGSASCPTLRYEPYQGDQVGAQLDSQMRSFLAGGGAAYDADARRLLLSRIFMWYGADFVRPHRMPTWIPASKRSIGMAVAEWLAPQLREQAAGAGIAYQSYDWGLACSIG
ncbi:MAG: DUF547 domain-containing protein [Actinomycetota bacterium]|nr:DUF547 domain-containing protein [Actinomycetota bacterium]